MNFNGLFWNRLEILYDCMISFWKRRKNWKDRRNSKDVCNELQVKQLVNFNCGNDLASLVPLFVDDLICIHFVSVLFLNAVILNMSLYVPIL